MTRCARGPALAPVGAVDGAVWVWVVAGAFAAAIALFADQLLGAMVHPALARVAAGMEVALPGHVRDGAVRIALVYAATLALAPSVVAVGLLAAAWFWRRHRRAAASAALTLSTALVVFNARQLILVDFLGWPLAARDMVIGNRTTATTAMAVVLAFVLQHERLVSRPIAVVVATGVSATVGLTRIWLGVHDTGDVLVQGLAGALMAVVVIVTYLFAGSATPRPE
jgi:hypothetical protein